MAELRTLWPVFEITAHSIHKWEWPLHKGIDLTLLNPETPFPKEHRLTYHGPSVLRTCFGGNVRLEARLGPFRSGVGAGKPGLVNRALGYSQPHTNQNSLPLSILVFNILREKKRGFCLLKGNNPWKTIGIIVIAQALRFFI